METQSLREEALAKYATAIREDGSNSFMGYLNSQGRKILVDVGRCRSNKKTSQPRARSHVRPNLCGPRRFAAGVLSSGCEEGGGLGAAERRGYAALGPDSRALLS